jgi:hypothetical protein
VVLDANATASNQQPTSQPNDDVVHSSAKSTGWIGSLFGNVNSLFSKQTYSPPEPTQPSGSQAVPPPQVTELPAPAMKNDEQPDTTPTTTAPSSSIMLSSYITPSRGLAAEPELEPESELKSKPGLPTPTNRKLRTERVGREKDVSTVPQPLIASTEITKGKAPIKMYASEAEAKAHADYMKEKRKIEVAHVRADRSETSTTRPTCIHCGEKLFLGNTLHKHMKAMHPDANQVLTYSEIAGKHTASFDEKQPRMERSRTGQMEQDPSGKEGQRRLEAQHNVEAQSASSADADVHRRLQALLDEVHQLQDMLKARSSQTKPTHHQNLQKTLSSSYVNHEEKRPLSEAQGPYHSLPIRDDLPFSPTELLVLARQQMNKTQRKLLDFKGYKSSGSPSPGAAKFERHLERVVKIFNEHRHWLSANVPADAYPSDKDLSRKYRILRETEKSIQPMGALREEKEAKVLTRHDVSATKAVQINLRPDVDDTVRKDLEALQHSTMPVRVDPLSSVGVANSKEDAEPVAIEHISKDNESRIVDTQAIAEGGIGWLKEKATTLEQVGIRLGVVDPEGQRLVRSLHTRASGNKSAEYSTPPSQTKDASREEPANRMQDEAPSEPPSEPLSEMSLLEELFPEASSYVQPHYTERNPYPKLDLPNDIPLVRRTVTESGKSQRERILEAFKKQTEVVTALQLLHCSTELTESDFRRLIPKGKHIGSWHRDSDFMGIIPGRDPLSLERLPFYYILFRSPESALAYQNNVARLHKLAGLHTQSSIFSAIPPPKGFLEDGEDLNAVLSSYLLAPPDHKLHLNMVMQPYNPSLRTLLHQGGYSPIVPHTTSEDQSVWKVLLRIEGWEPKAEDLFFIFTRHAYERGLVWPFHNNEHGISRLRDIVDVKARLQAVSSSNPRAASSSSSSSSPDSNASLDSLALDHDEDGNGNGEQPDTKGGLSQLVMNRLYNRWVVEFSDQDAARRFARVWNRRVLPSPKVVTWRDTEEVRMVNAEFLW